MSNIAVNAPKTPVTEGSGGKAPATMPNVCKMPGPPAPFVPTPLPNLGNASDNLADGTSTVRFEGKKVALKGSSFKSKLSGDMASQGTGGGIISSQTQGKTEWVAPGSMDVKAEGKNIQLLGDAMTNNGGSPTNSATVAELQDAKAAFDMLQKFMCDCSNTTKPNKQSTCAKLGNQVQGCVEKKINKHRNTKEPPKIRGERGYNKKTRERIRSSRQEAFLARKLKGTTWPDACILGDDGKPNQFFDLKYQCPKGTLIRKSQKKGKIFATGTTIPDWRKGQKADYMALGEKLGIDNDSLEPRLVTNENCP